MSCNPQPIAQRHRGHGDPIGDAVLRYAGVEPPRRALAPGLPRFPLCPATCCGAFATTAFAFLPSH
jgi:hypothetical protein